MELISKFRSVITDFGVRRLSFEDFLTACVRLKITVARHPMPMLLGFFTRVHGRKYIFLDSALSGRDLDVVAFHELAHAVLHDHPRRSLAFYQHDDSHEEHEADFIAFIATNYEKPNRHHS